MAGMFSYLEQECPSEYITIEQYAEVPPSFSNTCCQPTPALALQAIRTCASLVDSAVDGRMCVPNFAGLMEVMKAVFQVP